ncbi:DUF2252 domain-containing protein [Kitasatospora atroaurantiaca]|uniref:Uncharacterized protein (DUF2252 family) n=1 Tax=Kitasatospora atroaurantiaca TaxID=285545 RepID=A0A561ELR7_9ACTN|nr:DUF2252 domain-containing protein [Kitasatospora atroaurantiaca]TWE16566.1 uncharacterized protein (DUF2252 family) [Kitasatospora atroaurantiaca]
MATQLNAADREPARADTILKVFDTAFGELLAQDPAAFRVKFRKMAASAFAFYRGTAGLYYADLTTAPFEAYGARFLDEHTSRVWIHGDLHAENFGTYLNAEGRLVFNVNDFDEAYVGAFTWDVQRLAASLALIGYAKALSDGTITELVRVFATAYRGQISSLVASGPADAYTLDTATGPILSTLQQARLQTRVELLDELTVVDGYERRFRSGGGSIPLDEATRAEVLSAFTDYLTTLPPASRARPDALRVKDVVGRRGIGIGSAGLPSYNLLLEGHTDALENDVVIYMKQGQTPAVSRHVTDQEIRGYFRHEGHRTVISQRALQAHSDPWLGYATLRGQGQLVAEVSPYAADLDWTDLNEPGDLRTVVDYLGRATATMHAAADESSSGHSLVPFSTEHAIDAAISADERGFNDMLVDFAHTYGDRARSDHQIFVDLFRNGRIPGL